VATARPDDEPVTDEDRRRFHLGQAWFAQRGGEGIRMEDVLAECGFQTEDLFPYRIEWLDEAKADVRVIDLETDIRIFGVRRRLEA
jgi:hypothetical protein